MPRYAANPNLLFNEVSTFERYARAAAAGFTHVEVLFPYKDGPERAADELPCHGLEYIPAATEQGLDSWLPSAARANR